MDWCLDFFLFCLQEQQFLSEEFKYCTGYCPLNQSVFCTTVFEWTLLTIFPHLAHGLQHIFKGLIFRNPRNASAWAISLGVDLV